MMLRAFLEDLDVAITEAENGEEVIEICKTKSFDVIFIDKNMPKKSGCDTVKELRNLMNDQVPVIFGCTSYAQVDEMKDAGCHDVIAKPVKKQDVLGGLKKYKIIDIADEVLIGKSLDVNCEVKNYLIKTEIIDPASYMDDFENKLDILLLICESFIESFDTILKDLGQAFREKDPIRLRSVFHRIRGSIRFFDDETKNKIERKLYFSDDLSVGTFPKSLTVEKVKDLLFTLYQDFELLKKFLEKKLSESD